MAQREASQIGERIRSARKRAGLSHDRLGAIVGTSRQHLIRLEKGQHQPRDGMLGRIAAATGQPLAFFENGDGPVEDDEEADSLSLDDFLRQRIRLMLAEEARA